MCTSLGEKNPEPLRTPLFFLLVLVTGITEALTHFGNNMEQGSRNLGLPFPLISLLCQDGRRYHLWSFGAAWMGNFLHDATSLFRASVGWRAPEKEQRVGLL